MTRCAPVSAGDPGPALAPPHTDWLRHDLIVTGPVPDVTALRGAAAGAGAIPWAYPDLDRWEEDQVLALVQPPDRSVGLSPTAARVLARQLRSAVETHHQRVLAASGTTPCPFDLHAIVPLPHDILQRGPDDPASHAWLQTTGARHARCVMCGIALTRRSGGRAARHGCTSNSGRRTGRPGRCSRCCAQRYPTLTFDVRPEYGDG